jgi:hypothetical protein
MGYILNVVKGIIDDRKMLRMNVKTHKLGRKLGIDHILLDMRKCVNRNNSIQQFDFSFWDMAHDSRINQDAVIAILVGRDDHSHDFAELMEQKAGRNVKLFHNYNEAIEYLQISQPVV